MRSTAKQTLLAAATLLALSALGACGAGAVDGGDVSFDIQVDEEPME